jgi:galactokinase
MDVADLFQTTFGDAGVVSLSIPGRVNLIGEHTDYNGGNVLPAAISRRVNVALARGNHETYQIKSDRFDGLIERSIGDQKRGDWTDYATGALEKARALGWLEAGAQLAITSDIPDGAGVSSSAALITAILNTAKAIAGAEASPVDIAKHARAVENDYIGMPCGIMDQMAVGLADEGSALALNTVDLSYDVIAIPEGWRFVTLHSGIRRELSDGRYKQRFEECEAARAALGVEHLCHATPAEMAATALPKALATRVRHVTTEHARTLEAADAMAQGDAARFGALMNESHASYAMDFEASTPEIDALVADALRHGAKGARLTGGGFGGCIVALVKAANAKTWTDSMLEAHHSVWLV